VTTSPIPVEHRLETVLARAANSIQVSQPPPLPEAARARRRPRRARWIAVGAAAGLAVSGGSIAAATLIQPHTYLDPLRSRVSPTSPAVHRAVMATMPSGGRIVTTQQVTGADSSYDDTVITAGPVTYDFTVYQRFSSAELDHFGLLRHRLPGGTAWIGSDTPTQRSVYYLANTGIGVYVRENNASGHIDGLSTVESLAQKLANSLDIASRRG
jgi:hypothetical protein